MTAVVLIVAVLLVSAVLATVIHSRALRLRQEAVEEADVHWWRQLSAAPAPHPFGLDVVVNPAVPANWVLVIGDASKPGGIASIVVDGAGADAIRALAPKPDIFGDLERARQVAVLTAPPVKHHVWCPWCPAVAGDAHAFTEHLRWDHPTVAQLLNLEPHRDDPAQFRQEHLGEWTAQEGPQ